MAACAEILHMASGVIAERATQAECVGQVSSSFVAVDVLHMWTMGVHTCQCVCLRVCHCSYLGVEYTCG